MNTCGLKIKPFIDSSDLLAAGSILQPQTLISRAERDGYLYFPGLLPSQLVTDLRCFALRLAAEAGWLEGDGTKGIANSAITRLRYDDESYIQWLQQIVPSREFRAVGKFSAIKTILEVLFDGPVQSQCGDLCRIFFPGTREETTLPHQDEFYVQSGTQQWTAWVPLGDCPVSLGPLAVIPGSQHLGLQTHRSEDAESQGVDISPQEIWACNDYAVGDALLFSPHFSPVRIFDNLLLT